MIKPIALANGHYECRSLKQTVPILTDVLALEVVDEKAGEVTLKHPNTDWLLIFHEGGATLRINRCAIITASVSRPMPR